jgi:hypothetical protein
VFYRSSGTITTLNLGVGAVFDKSTDPRTMTITNIAMYPNSTLLDPLGTITFSNGVVTAGGATLGSVTLNVGYNRIYTVT